MTNLTALILLDMAHPISECSQTGNKCCCELHFTTLSIPMTRVKNAGLTFNPLTFDINKIPQRLKRTDTDVLEF